ncbi:MAG: hypothetical protein IPL11_03640 [Candidatus Accumulibacter sp.]|nr:hypothetical protein [Accumulibacter sp.]
MLHRQQIAVDTRYRYQCDQTVQGYESLSCRRGVSVTVGFGQCTPGVWLGRTAFIDCGDCVDPYMAMNIFCGSDGRSYEVEPYRSGDGENRFDYRTLGYEWDGSYGRFPVAVAPGQSISDHYVSDLGYGCHLYVYFSVSCSATTCTLSAQRQCRLQLCRRQRHRGCAAAAVVHDGQQLAVERVHQLAAASTVMKALLAMLFAMTLAGQAIAGDCQLASSTCVDSSASKTISGIVVTLAQVGGCWEYQDTYTCIKPEAIDYCAALTTAGCGQVGATCSDTAFNGTCNTYSKTFQCGTDQGEPSNTLRLSNSYTLLTDAIDVRACSSYAQNARCRLAAHTCVDSTPCRRDASGATVCLAGVTPPEGGLNSTATCWRYQDDYSCIADDPLDYCAAIKATEGCTLVTSTCDSTAFDGFVQSIHAPVSVHQRDGGN